MGEPLNPEAVTWGVEVFGQPIHDNWWQTETGAILIANYPWMAVRPGSMGRPIPGVQVGILDDEYNEAPSARRVTWPFGRDGRPCSTPTGGRRSAITRGS